MDQEKEELLKFLTSREVEPAKLSELAAVHIKRYSKFLDAAAKGARGVNVEECNTLLRIWKHIEKNLNIRELDVVFLREITDAILDEE
jgi:hypothetical protein